MRWYEKLFIGFMVSCLLAMFPLAYLTIQRDHSRARWCIEHGYDAVSVGSRPYVACVDDQRRLILPGN
jgi:hypothetical protein